ncbi:hypothetical protein GTPT_0542 [Tatumella ptyseos ATCC 33301]|uniref:Uncharacterized protein n=1 Tax=Tatumella ptyseos ATCC 33301 TaxID=1005995 RepID=A0A085JPH2_9GAMM|nr:hypothetical protein GTPT_0542 [Tatumella ptyseos ATCC 33301]
MSALFIPGKGVNSVSRQGFLTLCLTFPGSLSAITSVKLDPFPG